MLEPRDLGGHQRLRLKMGLKMRLKKGRNSIVGEGRMFSNIEMTRLTLTTSAVFEHDLMRMSTFGAKSAIITIAGYSKKIGSLEGCFIVTNLTKYVSIFVATIYTVNRDYESTLYFKSKFLNLFAFTLGRYLRRRCTKFEKGLVIGVVNSHGLA